MAFVVVDIRQCHWHGSIRALVLCLHVLVNRQELRRLLDWGRVCVELAQIRCHLARALSLITQAHASKSDCDAYMMVTEIDSG